MKKIKTPKRLLSVLLALLMAISALLLAASSSFAASNSDFGYRVLSETEKTCEITKYTGSAKELTIPSKIDGYVVTEIGIAAFDSYTSLTSITIPDSVTKMDSDSFWCTSLTEIKVSSGNKAYSSENGVLFNKDKTKLICCPAGKQGIYTIPDSVTSFGDYFSGFPSLAEIKVSAKNTAYSSENGVLFNKDKTELIRCPGSKQGAYTIPNGVTSIEGPAFNNCTSLTSITIPGSVASLDDNYFIVNSCTSLTEIKVSSDNKVYSSENGVLFNKDKTELICCPKGKQGAYTIPDGVTSIGDYGFNNCTSLTSIMIPADVTNLWSSAFRDCTSLTEINVSDENVAYSSEDGVLFDKDKQYLLYCPAGKQGSYTIPNSVKDFYGAFDECSLAEINVSSGNTAYSSENGVLFNKAKTELIRYPAAMPNTVYIIPNGVTDIGEYAFSGCTSLTSVSIPDGVTIIEWCAFADCTSLTDIIIPNGVKDIDDLAFLNCTSLVNVNVPDSVTRIGKGAFYDCTSLKSITIPADLTNLWEYAFRGCTSLTIYSYSGSRAEEHAKYYNIPFIALNGYDSTSGIQFSEISLGAVPAGSALKVENIESSEKTITYDISLMKDGVEIQPGGSVTVRIPVSAAMNGADCKVYRAEMDGTYTDMNAIYENGFMVFTTNHFSKYILTTENLSASPGGVNPGQADNTQPEETPPAVTVAKTNSGMNKTAGKSTPSTGDLSIPAASLAATLILSFGAILLCSKKRRYLQEP